MHDPPIPLSLLVDDDVLQRVMASGLPATRKGVTMKRMLEGTDIASIGIGEVQSDVQSDHNYESDVKHLRLHCYWLWNRYPTMANRNHFETTL